MARIALDAMGGDFAPQATVAGALLALAELDPAHTIQLVGRTAVVDALLRDLLNGELASHKVYRDRLSIVEAPDVVEMTDKPSAVVRGKPNSSMSVGRPRWRDDRVARRARTGRRRGARATAPRRRPIGRRVE